MSAAGRSSSRRRGRRAKPSSRSSSDKGVDADGVAGLGQFALDVVDGEVALAHGDDQFAHRVTRGCALGPMARGAEELALVGVVAKLVAQDAEGAWGVAEASRDLLGGAVFDEVGTQGLVLALQGMFGGKEEPGFWVSYVFTSTQRHTSILLYYQSLVKHF